MKEREGRRDPRFSDSDGERFQASMLSHYHDLENIEINLRRPYPEYDRVMVQVLGAGPHVPRAGAHKQLLCTLEPRDEDVSVLLTQRDSRLCEAVVRAAEEYALAQGMRRVRLRVPRFSEHRRPAEYRLRAQEDGFAFYERELGDAFLNREAIPPACRKTSGTSTPPR